MPMLGGFQPTITPVQGHPIPILSPIITTKHLVHMNLHSDGHIDINKDNHI